MFQSNRRFRLWEFSSTFNQVSIRSLIEDGLHTNIDIIFWGVQEVSVPVYFESMYLEGSKTNDPRASSESRVYVLNGTWEIVASGYKVLENRNPIE